MQPIAGYDLPELLLAWVVTLAAGALQGSIGFGFGVLSVPVLTLIDPRLTPVPQLLLAFPMTVYMAWRERGDLSLRGFGPVVAGRVPGSVVGAVLLTTVSRRMLDGIIALAVLSAVAVIAWRASVPRTPLAGFLAGVASGVTSTAAAIGGPPVALLFHGERGGVVRSNMAAVFSAGVLISIGVLTVAGAITRRDLATAALLFPALAAGLSGSSLLTKRVEGRPLRVGMLVVAALAGLVLALRTVLG